MSVSQRLAKYGRYGASVSVLILFVKVNLNVCSIYPDLNWKPEECVFFSNDLIRPIILLSLKNWFVHRFLSVSLQWMSAIWARNLPCVASSLSFRFILHLPHPPSSQWSHSLMPHCSSATASQPWPYKPNCKLPHSLISNVLAFGHHCSLPLSLLVG